MIKRKRIFFDIEVSPNVGFFWNPGHKVSISYDNIIKERAIICICYKWEGEKAVHSLRWDSGQSDKKMLREFVRVANTAQELVGHNGDKFDLAWIRTRCLLHGIKMFPGYVTIDTLKAARSKFRFNSNRLDYIAKFLGIGAKIKTDFSLWKKVVLDNCSRSMKKMIHYCKGDVRLLERVFTLMSDHLPAKTHYGVLSGRPPVSCPHCGSETKINHRRVSAAGVARVQRKCKSCGKYHTTRDYEEKNPDKNSNSKHLKGVKHGRGNRSSGVDRKEIKAAKLHPDRERGREVPRPGRRQERD